MKKKIISILFALMLMLTLCIIVSADEYTEWSISEDGQTLIVGSDTYKLYEEYLYPTDKFLPEKSFIYENTSPSYLYLKRNYEENGIMIVSDYYNGTDTDYIYVNNEGRATLNSFINGAFSNYKISDRYFSAYASTSKTWVSKLDGGSIVTIDVRSLEGCQRYYVLGYDSTETIAHIIGAIYEGDDTYYFVNYDKLSNNYFDANGNFSYRQGTVKAYKLNTAQASDIVEYIANMTTYEKSYEADVALFTDLSRDAYVVIFVLFTVIFGFITPLVPVIIGAIRVSKGKSKNPRRWYLMFIGCGLWIVFAICILLTLIF